MGKKSLGASANPAGRSRGISRARKVYGNEDVISEAKKRKDGGEVKVPGRAAGGRLDRKHGGRADKSPFSSAGGGGATKNPFSSAKMG